MKKLGVIITNRTNYSKLGPILFQLKKTNLFLIEIITSSASIISKYGNLITELKDEGFQIKKIDNLLLNDEHSSMGISFGVSSILHSNLFSENEYNFLLVVGDRYDTLAAVISAKFQNIPIVHIQGGEESGSVDNTIRDLISKCSDLHFPSTDKSKNKLIRMGLDKNKIFNYGCPAVEKFVQESKKNNIGIFSIKFQTKNLINIKPNEPYFVVLIHPDTTSNDVNLDTVLQAIDNFGIKTFLFYPNVDATNSKLLSSQQRKLNDENYIILKHLNRLDFIALLKTCKCFIGNSSSGIRESASLNIPFVNIGQRQKNREQNRNTINCGFVKNEIVDAINKAIELNIDSKNIYYKKGTSKLITNKIIEFYG